MSSAVKVRVEVAGQRDTADVAGQCDFRRHAMMTHAGR
jgi:hypothetical protein